MTENIEKGSSPITYRIDVAINRNLQELFGSIVVEKGKISFYMILPIHLCSFTHKF